MIIQKLPSCTSCPIRVGGCDNRAPLIFYIYLIFRWSLNVMAVNAWRMRQKVTGEKEEFVVFVRELVVTMLTIHGTMALRWTFLHVFFIFSLCFLYQTGAYHNRPTWKRCFCCKVWRPETLDCEYWRGLGREEEEEELQDVPREWQEGCQNPLHVREVLRPPPCSLFQRKYIFHSVVYTLHRGERFLQTHWRRDTTQLLLSNQSLGVVPFVQSKSSCSTLWIIYFLRSTISND